MWTAEVKDSIAYLGLCTCCTFVNFHTVEEDYCSPPLAMERESVLDRYFDDITVERVNSEEKGWKSLEDKPLLWNQ